MIDFSDIEKAYHKLSGVVHRTPVLTSRTLNQLSGNELFFKCENFQRIGAFKIRGAYNKISSLSADQLQRGVVAYSSGNHAQGVALAARLLNTHAKIVMPDNAPKPKVTATKAYGGEIIFYDYATEDREAIGQKIADSEGRAIVPPFNDEFIMAGQGTLGIELAGQITAPDYVFFPVGGGGLISGNAIALKHLIPDVKIIGVETETANDVYQSFQKGEIIKIKPPKTIADGMRTLAPGTLTFPVIQSKVDNILLVSDEEVIEAMRLIYNRLKIVVEPTAAVPFAAVRKNELQLKNKRIAIVLSGGNIDMDDFFDLLRTKD
jgi:threo-3-hydroxy-L-aspartate ammonia-lyase